MCTSLECSAYMQDKMQGYIKYRSSMRPKEKR